jgi:hypothetical protein
MSTTPPSTILGVNGHHYAIQNAEELERHFERVQGAHYAEIWLQRDSGQSLGVLINRNRAVLVYGRFEGDPGFSSRTSLEESEAEERVEFILSNGQCADYPASWTVSTEAALRAIVYLFTHGQPAPWITWHDDT